jgi:hypothetical protein
MLSYLGGTALCTIFNILDLRNSDFVFDEK